MPQIIARADILRFASKKAEQLQRDAMERRGRLAARAFIRAALAQGVPVQTGMAKGSFLNLGAAVSVFVPISPKREPGVYVDPYTGETLSKEPATAQQLSTQPADIFRWEGNRFKFVYNSRVHHFNIEDFIGVVSPTAPWQTFFAGQRAFIREMEGLPGDIADATFKAITVTEVTYGPKAAKQFREKRLQVRRQRTHK